jgi:hypothetical protein
VPAPPTVTSTSTTASSLTIFFAAPSDTGGSAVTDYTATCASSNGGSKKSVSGSSSPLVVEGLTQGSQYDCYLSAANAAGPSPWSQPVSLSPAWTDTSYYHCPSGGSLSGNTCTQTVFSGYSCNQGGSILSGSTCRRTDFVGYYCPGGEVLSGTTCITPGYWSHWWEWMEIVDYGVGAAWVCPTWYYAGREPSSYSYDTLTCNYYDWVDPADYGASASWSNYDYAATPNYSHPTYTATLVQQGFWSGWNRV